MSPLADHAELHVAVRQLADQHLTRAPRPACRIVAGILAAMLSSSLASSDSQPFRGPPSSSAIPAVEMKRFKANLPYGGPTVARGPGGRVATAAGLGGRVPRVADSGSTAREQRQLVPLAELPEDRPRAAEPAVRGVRQPARPAARAARAGVRGRLSLPVRPRLRARLPQGRAPAPRADARHAARARPPFAAPKTPSGRAIPLATPPLPARPRAAWASARSPWRARCSSAWSANAGAAATSPALCCAAAAFAALWATSPLIEGCRLLAYGLGPLGALLAALAARHAIAHRPGLVHGHRGRGARGRGGGGARAGSSGAAREPIERALHGLVASCRRACTCRSRARPIRWRCRCSWSTRAGAAPAKS